MDRHRKIAGGQPAIFLKMRGKERRKNEEAIYIGTLLRGDCRLSVLPCRRVLFRQRGQCVKREEMQELKKAQKNVELFFAEEKDPKEKSQTR